MKNLLLVIAAFAFAAIQFACAPKATKEECQATCGKATAMEMSGGMKADGLRQAQEAAAAKVAAVEREKADAMAKLDADHAKAKGPKAKLAKDLATKKEALTKSFAEKEQTIAKENAESLKAASDAHAKAMAAEAEKAKKATEECLVKCEGKWSKAMIECQAKSTKIDEFNACK